MSLIAGHVNHYKVVYCVLQKIYRQPLQKNTFHATRPSFELRPRPKVLALRPRPRPRPNIAWSVLSDVVLFKRIERCWHSAAAGYLNYVAGRSNSISYTNCLSDSQHAVWLLLSVGRSHIVSALAREGRHRLRKCMNFIEGRRSIIIDGKSEFTVELARCILANPAHFSVGGGGKGWCYPHLVYYFVDVP